MSTSLSINPCSYRHNPILFTSKISCSCTSTISKPISLINVKTRSLSSYSSKTWRILKVRSYSRRPFIVSSAGNERNATENSEEEEKDDNPPFLDEFEMNSRPRRIALFVEPSPFAHVSGYKNRFQNFIRYLREMGDEVMVVTTHEGVPKEFYGAQLIGSRRLLAKSTLHSSDGVIRVEFS